MEGIEQNSLLYDIMLNAVWDDPVKINDLAVDQGWLRQYLFRRYGFLSNGLMTGWTRLMKTVYSSNEAYSTPVFIQRPGPERFAVAWNPDVIMGVEVANGIPNPFRLMPAILALKEESGRRPEHEVLRDDLVLLVAQALGETSYTIYASVESAWRSRNPSLFEERTTHFLRLLDEAENVCRTSGRLLLGRWLESAKTCATCEEETALYEYNARLLIAGWGGPYLYNYATKLWSGFIRDYHRPRWSAYFDRKRLALRDGVDFDDVEFNLRVAQWEEDWCRERTVYPTEPSGDPLAACGQALAFIGM